jgi:serine/threonine protein kinase/tetratricopeptide (TPR) repeat protein
MNPIGTERARQMTAAARPLKDLFLAALDVAPAERPAWLDRECPGDSRLRETLQRMLAAHDTHQSLLDGPGDSPAPPPAADPWATSDLPTAGPDPGTVIGPYKLLEEIGEGGFGVVYLAEQTNPVRRKVALKVLKPGMDSKQVVARFEAERQALAIMDHSNIARVFDGGTTSEGQPYFVMEFVRGVPITDFCDQNHLTPRDRLGLFVQVCGAVQHAHQKGVIHRDIKPSNVLVTRYDTTPVVKVIDFGVAKALGQGLTDKTLFTGVAQMVGTPLYMSPEQAGMSDLDVDTRSDVYSLGVLLYELLTGTTPFPRERFRKAAYDEIRRIIREEEPPKPSTRLTESKDLLPSVAAQRHTEPARLTKLVRGELDWIVMRALEKDRNRRYETANGLAADVQRYLADEPVLACPPSVGYRLRKFVRKNRRAVIAAAMILLSVVAGAIGAVYGVIESEKQRTAALQRQIEDERREADAAADRAARRSRTAASVATALDDARARTGEAWGLADEPYKMRTATDLALAAVRRAEGFANAGEAPEESLADLAAARVAMADLDRHTRLFVAADQALQAQDLIREGQPGRERTAEKLGIAFRSFGWDPIQAPADAIAAEIAASRVRNKVLGLLCDWESMLLGRDRAANEQIQKVIRAARVGCGGHLADWQRMKDARDLAGLAKFAARPEVTTLGPELLVTLSRDLRYYGFYEEAILALLRRAADRYPTHVWVNHELSIACLNASPPRRLEAFRAMAAAAATRPDNVLFQTGVGQAYSNLGDTDLAAAQYRRVVALAPTDEMAYSLLADLRTRAGDPAGAVAVYRECIGRVDSASSYYKLGNLLFQVKDLVGAGAAFREAIRRKADSAAAHDSLGVILRAQGDLDGAIAAHEEALRIVRRDRGLVTHVEYAHENLWAALVQKNVRLGTAADAAALAAFAAMSGFDPKDHWPHVRLGTMLWDKGDTKGAIARFRDAVQIGPAGVGFDWEFVAALESLGSALLAERDCVGAVAAYRERARRWRNYSGHSDFGDVLAQAGDMAEAIAEYNEAIRIKPYEAESHAKLAKMLAAGPDGVRDGQKAIEHATQACELGRWKEPRHIAILADAFAEAGEFGKAVEYQKKALFFPEFEKQHGDQARKRLDLYAHQKPYRETEWGPGLVAPPRAAVWKYWWRVQRDPKNADAQFQLGNVLRTAGQLDRAVAAYREAVRLDGDRHGAAIDALADLQLSRGNLKEALATYQRSLALAPENPSAHRGLGNARKASGDLDGALAAYRTAAAAQEKCPANSNSLYNAACYRALTAAAQAQAKSPDAARLAKEEADRAMERLNQAVKAGYVDLAHIKKDANLDPLRQREEFQNLVARLDALLQARSYIRLSQWDKAAAEYAKAELLAQPLGDDAFAYACLFLIRGDGESYRRYCQGMVWHAAQTTDHFEAYVLARSCALARQGPVDPARAVQWGNQAVDRSQPAWYLHALGLAQYRAGQFDQALQSFTRADAGWTLRDLNLFGLALVHHSLGHADEARRCLAKGIQWLEREGPPGPGRPARLQPQDWLEAQLLRREAEEALKVK